MRARRISALAAVLAAASAASAFRSTPNPSTSVHRDVPRSSRPSSPSCSCPRRDLSLAAYYPPYDPFNPFFQYSYNPHQSIPYARRRRMRRPRYSAAVDVDAEVIAEDEEELLREMEEEREWLPDRVRAGEEKGRRGEVISFDPSERPMKSAAAYPSDLYEDENKFQGRKPGQAVNKRSDDDEDYEGRKRSDPREQHVLLDEYEEYENSFFRPPMPPPGAPRRPGPSVYTREEEDLIAAMGGRGGPRTTQEFAGLGTMTKGRGHDRTDMPVDPQQSNYNPEQLLPMPPPPPPGAEFIPPPPPPGFEPRFREEGYLGDSTLEEISLDYSVPIPYLADVIATWGAPVPIDPAARLGDMVTGEQAFAILEAIHTLDIASLHDRYSEDNLMNICEYYDISMKEAFDFCVGRGWALPFGVRTFLRVEQEEELLDALG